MDSKDYLGGIRTRMNEIIIKTFQACSDTIEHRPVQYIFNNIIELLRDLWNGLYP